MTVKITRPMVKSGDATPKRNDSNDYIFWFDGDNTNQEFVLTNGWTPVRVFVGGYLMREGDSEDYVVTYDGFLFRIVFSVAPSAVSVAIDSVRTA